MEMARARNSLAWHRSLSYHPEVQVLHFCLMPDHLHFILYVRHTMPTGIKVHRGRGSVSLRWKMSDG